MNKTDETKLLTARGPQHDFEKNRNGEWTGATFSSLGKKEPPWEFCRRPGSASTIGQKKTLRIPWATDTRER